ncbi:MAG: response regulator [Candidatus Hydrogenedentes bacterium]|nr:response regulator [Candidatus Hydrogenedentota bacterium]
MDTLNILVVDDDRDFAEALTDVLEAENHRVDRCHTGEDAVQLFEHKNYDISFMDVKLPHQNGVESFLEIRSRKPDARVVMMTGYSMEQLLQRAVENGAWAVMHKPLDMLQVLEIVEAVPAAPLVVIVDEEPGFIAALTSALGAEGLRAVVAEGDVEAVRLVRDESTDLVILDLHVPADGLVELFHSLRARGQESPAIIVTGEAPGADSRLASLCEGTRVALLLKPCDPAAVARLAASMVKKG